MPELYGSQTYTRVAEEQTSWTVVIMINYIINPGYLSLIFEKRLFRLSISRRSVLFGIQSRLFRSHVGVAFWGSNSGCLCFMSEECPFRHSIYVAYVSCRWSGFLGIQSRLLMFTCRRSVLFGILIHVVYALCPSKGFCVGCLKDHVGERAIFRQKWNLFLHHWNKFWSSSCNAACKEINFWLQSAMKST